MTNDELNERKALALGWEPHGNGWWETSFSGELVRMDRAGSAWITSADACLDDLLPVMKAKVPGEVVFMEDDDQWRATLYPHAVQKAAVDAYDATLSRAICLVFLAVMEATL